MNQDLSLPTPVAAPEIAEVRIYRSPAAQIWRQFWRDPGAICGAVIVALLVLTALFAPALAPYEPSRVFDDGLTIQGLPVPSMLPATALVAVLQPSVTIIIVVIGVVYWTGLARVVHAQVLRLREQDFVTAAYCTGVPESRILLRHILPHLISTAIVWGTLGIATNVMLEASLSFLGIGVQPPTPSWGRMISEGQTYYRTAPWLILFPGIAIMLTVLGFNLLGDGLRDALDPYQRR